MKLKHYKALAEPVGSDKVALGTASITHIAIAPDGTKLAAFYSAVNQVALFALGPTTNAMSSLSLKPANKTESHFYVTGMAFSLDSERLAIGQSDCVIYVYKIGDVT